MANYSKFLELVEGRAQTIDLSQLSNILTLGGGGLQFNGTSSGHVVIAGGSAITSYSLVLPSAQGGSSTFLQNDGSGNLSWASAGSGSVTTVSVVSTNGFAGTVANASSTPAITIETTVTGILYGNGTSVAAATAAEIPDLSAYYANLALSNLSSVAINTSLLPGTDQSINLGSTSKSWSAAYIHQLNDGSGTIAVDPYDRKLDLGSGALSVDWGNHLLSDSVYGTALDWSNRYLEDQSAGISIDWQNRLLEDAGQNVSVDYANRYLKDSAGGNQLQWSSSGINLGVDNTLSGILTLSNGSASAHTVISAQHTASSYNFNLPATAGTSGYALTSAGGGSSAMTWSAFQAPGSYITALTGDVTASGPGSVSATLATVNTDVGTYGDGSNIPVITVNGKGLITAISTDAVVAPAGTLTGTTLASGVTASSLTSLGTQAQALDMGTHQINNVSSPSASTDAANKGYVDAAINGLTWKGPVEAYSVSNVALTGGATLTIDSYSVQNGDYVILAVQTTPSEQGVYLASGIGSSYVLTLVSSGPEAATAIGDAYLVEKGTVYGNSAVQVNAISPNVTFIQFAGPNFYTFTSPLALSGNTVTVGYDDSTIGVTSNELYVKNAGISATQLATGAFDQVTIKGGAGTPAYVASTPAIGISGTYGHYVTLTANTTYAMRWGMPSNIDEAATYAFYTGTIAGTSTPVTITANNIGAIGNSVVLSFDGSAHIETKISQWNIANPSNQVTLTSGDGSQTPSLGASASLSGGIDAVYEVAGQFYLADWDTTSSDFFWVVGLYNSTSSTSTGATISVISKGYFALGSSDSMFGSSDQGKAVWLGASGAFVPNSTFSPSAGDANEKIGIAQSASAIFVDCQMMGIS